MNPAQRKVALWLTMLCLLVCATLLMQQSGYAKTPLRQKQGNPSSATTVRHLEIEVGHSQVVSVPAARQVAVGDSQTLQASAMSASEVVFFGKRAGATTVDIWDKQGKHHRFQVVVHAAGRMQTLETLRALLGDVAGLHLGIEGSQIVLRGRGISTTDRQLIERVLTRFPDVTDLTETTSSDPMILLEALVLELPSTRLAELGLGWRVNPDSGVYAGVATGTGDRLMDAAAGSAGNRHGSWSGLQAEVASTVQAMAKNGEAILLAQPKLIAQTGKTASFLAGGEIPYVITDSRGKIRTEFKKYGVSLNMTPTLVGRRRVVATVEVEVSHLDPTINTPAGPAMLVRKTSTQIDADSGQSIVLAGFLSTERATSFDGVPTRKNSFFDALFGKTGHQYRQTELAILVTPFVLDHADQQMQERVRRVQLYSDLETAGSTRLDTQTIPSGGYADPDTARLRSGQTSLTVSGSVQRSIDPDVTATSVWEVFEPARNPAQWVDALDEP